MTLDARQDSASRPSACRRIGEQLGDVDETKIRGLLIVAAYTPPGPGPGAVPDAAAVPARTDAAALRQGTTPVRRAGVADRAVSGIHGSGSDRADRCS